MARKLFLGLLWLALTTYAIASSFTKTQQGDFDLILKLSTGELAGINPIIIAIFYIMGIFPVIYAAFILFDSNQKISPYPFSAVSFGLGAFALLPYLALRQTDITGNKSKNWLLKILDSPLTAIAASVAFITLMIWGLTQGDWSDYVAQWQTSQFIHVMSIDFCLLSLLFPAILGDDMQRRGVKGWLKAIAFIPLFGALIYWCLRPQLW
ncbi:MAG: DUF2834 domain-containing protein [Pleurocapsa sp. SU_5_0]|nr:DUF2834 domain-containing protein [Pleurocapsa sp. SU_5_0]NJR45046.1 DUF2834 domain-containing protein [Hyellaceae cyanobacterium CSU_1_1]